MRTMLAAALAVALLIPAEGLGARAPVQSLPRGEAAAVMPRAQATAQCGPLGVVLGVLKARFGERLLWWGDGPDGVTMMVTERPDTRTWTLLAVHDGEACMMGSGGSARAQGS
ncbi:MAG: hypothetical protein M0002_13755 [Rhodospirillales bacterium]|nr:hypothetical protein [Rhodospirillales bacterium]